MNNAFYFSLKKTLLCHSLYVLHGFFLDMINCFFGSKFGFKFQEFLKKELHLLRRKLEMNRSLKEATVSKLVSRPVLSIELVELTGCDPSLRRESPGQGK